MDSPNKYQLSSLVSGGLLVLVLSGVYLGAAYEHVHSVNVNMEMADQRAYLSYGRKMAATRYEWVGGRNQMPVFPFLVSLLDGQELTLEQLFVRAKYLNTGLSLLVLLAVYGLLRRSLPVLESTTLSLIVAFTVYVYRAGYAQAELLYYGLFFLSFLLALRGLDKPGASTAVLMGGVTGIAHLTKASVLPLLTAFIFFAVLRTVVSRGDRTLPARREMIRGLALVFLSVACFLLTVSPYISTSKARFGRWFYNVNSRIYIWADS